jgi:hypothetical protein
LTASNRHGDDPAVVARDWGRWIAAAGLVGVSAAVVLWVRLLPLSREAMRALMASSRYGIHGHAGGALRHGTG